MKAALFVVSPNGQQQCAGEYVMQSETANGQPVWEQKAGFFWLYSGTNGMWIIGAKDAKDKNFKCSHGLIFCRTLHHGVSPDQVDGVWERLHEDSFLEDSTIVVSSKIRPSQSLLVVTPNGQQRCAGNYVLTDAVAHGLPVWQHQSGKSYVYCGTNGSWIIGGSDAKELGFNCSKGVIYSKRAAGGVMPDKIGGLWLRLSDSKFVEDSDLVVTIKPQRLYVQTPYGQHRCAGEYVPLSDRTANGYPIWEHTAGSRCWLYSGNNGMWIIGGNDAAAKNFACTRGVIYCQRVHDGRTPEKMVGNWMRLDGEKFREDPAIVVSTDPPSLHVLCPRGQQRCGGEYLLLSDRFRHQPVWKQRGGPLRICTGSTGTWEVINGTPKEGSEEPPLLKCQQVHSGQMPDKMLIWSRQEGEEMIEDKYIKVSLTSSISFPTKLHVSSPNGQQKCGGEYLLVSGESANSQPLWKQMGGKFWLYSGTNGLWIIGGGGAKRKNFECARGVIYSGTSHGGLMPHQVDGLWLRLDGQEFVEDNEIRIVDSSKKGLED